MSIASLRASALPPDFDASLRTTPFESSARVRPDSARDRWRRRQRYFPV